MSKHPTLRKFARPLASLDAARAFDRQLAQSAAWLAQSGSRILQMVRWAEKRDKTL